MQTRGFLVAISLLTISLAAGTPAAMASGPPPPPDPPITLTAGSDQTVQEGVAIGPVLGILHDADASGAASDYSGFVNWGDGTPAAALTFVQTTVGEFEVTATPHAYADAGSYFVGFRVDDIDDRFDINHASGDFTATITEAPITAYGTKDAGGVDYCGGVAGFDDANPLATPPEFTATIDWGDGTSSPGGIYTGSPRRFGVQGCHTYATLGIYSVTTTILDGSLTADAATTLYIYADTEGGTFVIGDQNAVGQSVTFWGARWADANPTSDGVAPLSFKGFADGRSPICIGTWSSGPGASSHPPASVPAFTAVLVTSSVSAGGALVEGNSIHIDIIETDAGYAPDLGAQGTGTIVFQAC